jgi:hypothetical protein
MKYYKSFEQYTSNGWKGTLFFIRNTSSPDADLKRGWSCHEWVDSEEVALQYQDKYGALASPCYDEFSGRWCADPELGLSSFAFHDEASYIQAMGKMEEYAGHDDKIALFVSSDYSLEAGLDSEDVFRNGVYLGYITWETSFAEIFDKRR